MQAEALKLITPEEQYVHSWDSFLSSSYLAEAAAAEHTMVLANKFSSSGRHVHAAFYREMSDEELGHAATVKRFLRRFIQPPKVSYKIYAGERFRCQGPALVAEMLSVIHLVFEPSAMAFVSYMQSHAEDIFDASVVPEARKKLAQVLKEEASHIKAGRHLLKEELKKLSPIELAEIKKSIKTHYTFISAGLRRFFPDQGLTQGIAKILDERYSYAIKNAMEGIIDANI